MQNLMCICSLVRINGNLSNKSFKRSTSLMVTCLIHKPFYKLTITSIFRQTFLIFQFTLMSVPSESKFTFLNNRQKIFHTKAHLLNSNFIFHILVKFPFPICFLFFFSIISGISYLCLNR